MAKNITRTITVYTYTTGKLDITSMTIKEMHQHVYHYKLGHRARRELEKTNGAPIIAESTTEKLYTMSLETFIEHAVPVEIEEAAEAEADGGND